MNPTALDRLANARPAEVVVTDSERESMLNSIVAEAVSSPRTGRRLAWRAAAAAAVAAAVTVAVSTQIVDGSPTPARSTHALRTTTLDSIRLAVSRSSEYVLRVRTDFHNGVLWDAWFDEATQRARTRSTTPNGLPIYDHQMSWDGEHGTVRVVSYADHAWWEYDVPDGRAVASQVPTPDEVRARVDDGSLREVGREGQLVHLHADAVSTAERRAPAFDLWVDGNSYLPVRLETSEPSRRTSISTFEWLPRTQANIAELNAPVPAGFERLSGAPATTSNGQG